MDFLQKCFYGVFELPLPRNAQKRTKKKVKKKKSDGGWVGLRFSKCTGGSVEKKLAALSPFWLLQKKGAGEPVHVCVMRRFVLLFFLRRQNKPKRKTPQPGLNYELRTIRN
jgi:hypothetical protein